ncbi:Lipase member H-B [Acromyrmex echinatior]|uniref:phospholipase A1 n=1 Tax=Acromyrmex echinatior TaxID=103372 RepID=F4X4E2_ACREC|nr:Lipase member H-B [Acromyrmex echinatior]
MDRVKEYIRRKSIERKGYRPLSPDPPSPPSREKARYWECPDEKASKSCCSSSTSSIVYLVFTSKLEDLEIVTWQMVRGLDPAGPLYNFLQPHLSLSDARFVDIIHTDYGFYGIARTTGTVDFFPNGGERIQPGCPQHPKFYSKDDFCSHQRSWKFYAESLINESAFLGVQCSSLSHLASGKCNNNTQIIMGYATPSSASVKKF